MIKGFSLIILIGIFAGISAKGQLYESYKHEGEVGASVGVGHYFGDLNTKAALDRPKLAGGIFFIKQFNNYIGLKIAANYAFLGYSDIYNENEAQRRRNLSFNTNVWELSASGYFNFFKFLPGVDGFHYTPYVSLGVGVISFDPYAYLNDEKYFLRPLGTEGQGSTLYPDRQPYSTMALSIPASVGFKYSINESVNVYGELTYRFTTTDYLDDVSTTYAGAEVFPPLPDGQPSVAFLLQDRSYETGEPIGIKGRQRGNSEQNDGFLTIQFGVSLNLNSYKCPKVSSN